MFEDIKLTARGRMVVGILQAIGTIAVMGFFLGSAAAFLIVIAP